MVGGSAKYAYPRFTKDAIERQLRFEGFSQQEGYVWRKGEEYACPVFDSMQWTYIKASSFGELKRLWIAQQISNLDQKFKESEQHA